MGWEINVNNIIIEENPRSQQFPFFAWLRFLYYFHWPCFVKFYFPQMWIISVVGTAIYSECWWIVSGLLAENKFLSASCDLYYRCYWDTGTLYMQFASPFLYLKHLKCVEDGYLHFILFSFLLCITIHFEFAKNTVVDFLNFQWILWWAWTIFLWAFVIYGKFTKIGSF